MITSLIGATAPKKKITCSAGNRKKRSWRNRPAEHRVVNAAGRASGGGRRIVLLQEVEHGGPASEARASGPGVARE